MKPDRVSRFLAAAVLPSISVCAITTVELDHVMITWWVPCVVIFFLRFFFLLLEGADDRPKLDIDRKKMQYKRYNQSYPNSTCKEHCDAKKGLVPYLQV